MFILDDKTALIGTTDLRSRMAEVEDMQYEKMVVMKREKPIAVIMTFDQYKKNRDRTEELEDLILGYMAKERDEKSTKKDYISLEEAAKKLGITL
ncbi:MAG: hypothetical protein WC777_05690 [Candidatus Gracilibacteria bacterium]|jgi:hypothetical protein